MRRRKQISWLQKRRSLAFGKRAGITTADAYAFTREPEKLHPDNSDKLHREQVAMFATKSAGNFKSYGMLAG